MSSDKLSGDKIMHYMRGNTIRELVNNANELGLQKEDVVGIQELKGALYLIYYNKE